MKTSNSFGRCIIIVADHFPPHITGIAEMAVGIANSLVARGWRVELIAPDIGDTDDQHWSFRVHRWLPSPAHIKGNSAKRLFQALRLRPKARRLAKESGAKYIFVSEAHSLRSMRGALTRSSLSYAGLRMGVLFHGLDLIRIPAMSRTQQWIYRRTLNGFNDVFTNSLFTAQCAELELGTGRPPWPIGCGITPDALPPSISQHTARRELGITNGPVLLTVSRLERRKGVDRTIEALPRIRKRYPSVQYIVAGDGIQRTQLEALARSTGCADCVHFLGQFPNEDKGKLYSAADVFVMPCRHIPSRNVEGFGIVFLEAAHYGVPVVAGCSGGVPDAVVNNETGLLVAPEYPEDIARGVLELLDNPDRARRMAERARERVHAEYTWDHVVQRLEAHLLSALTPGADAE